MADNYSLADIAAASGEGGFGGSNSWVLIILFALIFGFNGGGLFGGGNNSSVVSDSDLQRAIDLNSIQEGQAGISADIQRGIYEINGATKDAAYNNLSELRDIQNVVNAGFANMQTCCCETKQAIMENRYLAAQNTASINAVTVEQTQKILDKMASDRIASLEQQVNQLNLANALSGVMRYPSATTYTAGLPLYANSCNCNGNV